MALQDTLLTRRTVLQAMLAAALSGHHCPAEPRICARITFHEDTHFFQ